MNSNEILTYTFEALAYISFFAIIASLIRKKDKTGLAEFLSAATFGMLLEIGNIAFAHTYAYGAGFLVSINGVPIAIGLGWAVIIHGSMKLTDSYKADWKKKPFFDALTAFLIDISMDAVAIRLGLWKWIIPMDAEWFGVPYENLAAWILVVLSFSFTMRYLRIINPGNKIKALLYMASPVLSYILLIAGLMAYGFLSILPYSALNFASGINFKLIPPPDVLYNPAVQIAKLALLSALVGLTVRFAYYIVRNGRNKSKDNNNNLSSLALIGIHAFFIAAILIEGMHTRIPQLLHVGLLSLALHIFIHHKPGLYPIFNLLSFKSATTSSKR